MFIELDRKIKLDIFITAFATLTSVFFIILSYLWISYAVQILSILVIVLPTIYIIGSLIIRGVMENEYSKNLEELSEGIEEMQQEIDILKEENYRLRNNSKNKTL